jgi:type I restriction enzyme, S subunit
MEMRPGYKRTEVGVIPKDWRTVVATDIVDPNAPICYGVVQVDRDVDSGVPIVAIKFIKEIGSAPLHRTARDLERPYARSRVKAGDVLISIKGTIGRVGLVPRGFEGNISRELARLRPRHEYCGEYIAHQLEGGTTQARISRAVVGTTRLEFSIATLRQFELPVPPSALEQRAIAAALSGVDALLGGLDRLIAKKRDLKQAAMQQLLTGQTRLPGFSGEWEVKRLGDVAEIVSGGTPRTNAPSYWSGGIKWCTPTDVTRCPGKYLTETERTISRNGLNNSGATLLPLGALLLCSRATIGELKIAGAPICTNQGFKSLICRPETSNEFLYYKLLTMKQQMVERAFGSTFLEISTRNVSALEVATPSRREQTAIAAILSDMDAELSALEARRAKTRALKQAMMQELLTGRTRLV